MITPLATYYAFRCRVGKPKCYRKYPWTSNGPVTDWWYAVCKHCHRQSELH